MEMEEWEERGKQIRCNIHQQQGACGRRARTGPGGGDAHSELLSRQAYGGVSTYLHSPPRLG